MQGARSTCLARPGQHAARPATPARHHPSRRDVAAALTCVLHAAPATAAQENAQLQRQLDNLSPGGTLTLPGGLVQARLRIERSASVEGASDGSTVLEWRTREPYQSTVQVAAGAHAVLRNVTIRHESPSVANNYAVYNQGGDLRLVACRVASSSGSGVGCDGGCLALSGTEVSQCARNGLVIAGDLDGVPATATVVGSRVQRNGGSGAVVLDGSSLVALDSTISGNQGVGLELRDCEVELQRCSIVDNRKAAITQTAATLLTLSETQTGSLRPVNR